MSGVKIQINNVEALERLFGIKKGEDISLELRGNIVQEFTNKHLKGLASNEAIEKAVIQLKDDISLKVNAAFLNTEYRENTIIRQDIRNKIDEYIKEEVRRQLSYILDEPVKNAVKKAVDDLKDDEDNWLYHNTAKAALNYAFDKIKDIIDGMTNKCLAKDFKTFNDIIKKGM